MEIQRERILLSVQRALLGEIFSALRAVFVGWSSEKLTITWVVDAELSEADRLSITAVEAEVEADFEEGFRIESEVTERSPTYLTSDNSACVFERRAS